MMYFEPHELPVGGAAEPEDIKVVRGIVMAAPRPFTDAEKMAFRMFRERAIEYLNDLKDPDRD